MRFGLTAFCTDRSLDPAEVARSAETAGFSALFFPDHTHVPTSRATSFPGGGNLPDYYARTLDPFVAIAYAAAATSTLRIGVGVCLVPAREPIALAKTVATLDVLSGGRMLFGVGAGWNVEEVANHGIDPSKRWDVMRERVLAMKAIWIEPAAAYAGERVQFDELWSWPKPIQRPHPPIIVGGHGDRVLERVVEYGDEWLAMAAPGRPPLAERMQRLDRMAAEAGRRPPSVSVQVYGRPPPGDVIERYVAMGVDRIDLSVDHGPPDTMRPAIEELAAVVDRYR